ncbi:hypothetical protein N7470_001453 [Penicillium chermesinum]|nr:hypothetical protein N7470_001453 [Penicillium chermesinum]
MWMQYMLPTQTVMSRNMYRRLMQPTNVRLFTDGCRFNILGSWPNGKALVDVYEHVLADYSNDASFTAVPDENTVVNLGL